MTTTTYTSTKIEGYRHIFVTKEGYDCYKKNII